MREGEGARGMTERLIGLVALPKFYAEIAELEGIEITQGQGFKDKPHYRRRESIMCAVEGQVDVVFIPHVNR